MARMISEKCRKVIHLPQLACLRLSLNLNSCGKLPCCKVVAQTFAACMSGSSAFLLLEKMGLRYLESILGAKQRKRQTTGYIDGICNRKKYANFLIFLKPKPVSWL